MVAPTRISTLDAGRKSGGVQYSHRMQKEHRASPLRSYIPVSYQQPSMQSIVHMRVGHHRQMFGTEEPTSLAPSSIIKTPLMNRHNRNTSHIIPANKQPPFTVAVRHRHREPQITGTAIRSQPSAATPTSERCPTTASQPYDTHHLRFANLLKKWSGIITPNPIIQTPRTSVDSSVDGDYGVSDVESKCHSRLTRWGDYIPPICAPCNPAPKRRTLLKIEDTGDLKTAIDLLQKDDLNRLSILREQMKKVQRRIYQRQEDAILNGEVTKSTNRARDRRTSTVTASTCSSNISYPSTRCDPRASITDLSFMRFIRKFATSSPIRERDEAPSYPAKIFHPRDLNTSICDIRDLFNLSTSIPRNVNGKSPVILRVYDISEGMAKMWSKFLLCSRVQGIWHTGLLAFGYEYFYCDGVLRMLPQDVQATYAMKLKTIHFLGETSKGKKEFETFLETLSAVFTENCYDLLEWNCNDFTNICSMWLVNKYQGELCNNPSPAIDDVQQLCSTQSNRLQRMHHICGIKLSSLVSKRALHFIPAYILEQQERLQQMPVGNLVLKCMTLTERIRLLTRTSTCDADATNSFATSCRDTMKRMRQGISNAVVTVREETSKRSTHMSPWCC